MRSEALDEKPRERAASSLHAAPSLASALRRARTEAADHSQVVAELRGAEYARLEMLSEAMKPVLDQIPDSIDLFDTGLVPGDHPRYFLDMLAFVELGRDRRTYQFLQDTRHGRIVLAESDKIDVMVDRMTGYVARRLVEREMAMASDGTIEQAARALAGKGDGRGAAPAALRTAPAQMADFAPQPRRRFFYTALLFTIELLGAIVLFSVIAALAWFAWQAGWHWWSGDLGG